PAQPLDADGPQVVAADRIHLQSFAVDFGIVKIEPLGAQPPKLVRSVSTVEGQEDVQPLQRSSVLGDDLQVIERDGDVLPLHSDPQPFLSIRFAIVDLLLKVEFSRQVPLEAVVLVEPAKEGPHLLDEVLGRRESQRSPTLSGRPGRKDLNDLIALVRVQFTENSATYYTFS